MVKIVAKEKLTETTSLYELELPELARKAKAGQFLILRVDQDGERTPLTIADFDRVRGTVTIVVQALGYTTRLLSSKTAGDEIAGVTGPLGIPTHIERHGTVLCIGGGVGTACVYPIAREFQNAGNRVVSILGAKSKDQLIFKKKLEAVSDRVLAATDDGSFGTKGFVTDVLAGLIRSGETINHVFAVGPAVMMKAVADVTRGEKISTWVSLNPIMVDGTGMCGGCRVTVGGEVKFACVDGPDFDAHQVDFDELIARQRTYRDHETCHIGLHGAKS